MKRLMLVITSVLPVLLLNSCDDSVNPLEYKEGYILNCVIKTDTTFQVATISRTYPTNFLVQGGREEDYYVRGAKITLTCSNQNGTVTYLFRDTTISGSAGSSNLPTHFYYLKNFEPSIDKVLTYLPPYPPYPNYYNYRMTITAELPNGKKLISGSYSAITDSILFTRYTWKDYHIPNSSMWKFEILTSNFSTTGQGAKILPELVIKYEKLENGVWNKKEKLVPTYYESSPSEDVPVYPVINYDDTRQYVYYDSLVVKQTMEKISEGDSNKKNYRINNITFMLNLLSKGFADYLAAQQSFTAEFSYRIVPAIITNISGGAGVFGAMSTVKKIIPSKGMANSLGYQ
jgi:hypothetical protein